ncbi:4Fe-4S dicluster domain-containing protein [Gordonibacter massiliensis (ex Traore et al. 2017)]|uniref:4Fe-4S dicluster domain-containing protein n=1 Tax=Gordonibacter massiliensis (ex Traore et al. 2017) TaxID=1841863 RepID=UPI001C8BBA5C|nr:4Fe-4S dicluster domain-containing protein [Gordonibacter massiliensis (ex Traore et al. 2017)]MBX9032413.1 4Fe-4S dicluster domain-containing protein [Gordonibacter massiliensis (ex Traore et al. 2017)]
MAKEKKETVRKGFYFNQRNCIGCKTCQVACKDKNDLDIGILFRHVTDYEVGSYPTAKVYHYAATCNHCKDPACIAVCPNAAMYIDEEDGTVQHDDEKCIDCQYCVKACPYGVPQYIESINKVHKCDACIQLRAMGEQPACVAACPMRALEFGPIDELRSAHPDAVDAIAILPDPTQTNPSVAIDAKEVALTPNPVPVVL